MKARNLEAGSIFEELEVQEIDEDGNEIRESQIEVPQEKSKEITLKASQIGYMFDSESCNCQSVSENAHANSLPNFEVANNLNLKEEEKSIINLQINPEVNSPIHFNDTIDEKMSPKVLNKYWESLFKKRAQETMRQSLKVTIMSQDGVLLSGDKEEENQENVVDVSYSSEEDERKSESDSDDDDNLLDNSLEVPLDADNITFENTDEADSIIKHLNVFFFFKDFLFNIFFRGKFNRYNLRWKDYKRISEKKL